ncbi:MAG: zinc ribbon domain-containing protein [Candidatus Colwellbacteria bacterium]
MLNFLRHSKREEISRITPGFEEKEKQTPRAGWLLLIIMFVVGLFFGWRALDDLARLPDQPEPLSSCSYNYETGYLIESPVRPVNLPPLYNKDAYYDSYYEYDQSDLRCQFNEIEEANGVSAIWSEREPLAKEKNNLDREFGDITASLNDVQAQIDRLINEYSVGLEEQKLGVGEPIFPTGSARSNLNALRAEEQELIRQKDDLGSQIGELDGQIKSIDERLKETYKPIFEEQNKRLRWYEFKVFLLQFLFTLPLFWFSFRWYLRFHRKDSPYTVIALGILGVSSILFLKVILFWFWGLFLAQVFEVIIRWFTQYEIIRTLAFYLGMMLSFVVFGGAVYLLQKRVFDPRRVAIRRFRAKQCPHCRTNLDLAVFYCPNCGSQLKEKCEKCGQARFIGLPNCPSCGTQKLSDVES